MYGLRDTRSAYSRFSRRYEQCSGTIIDNYNDALFTDDKDFADQAALGAKMELGLKAARSEQLNAEANLARLQTLRAVKPQLFEKQLVPASNAAQTIKTVTWGSIMLQDDNRFGPLTVFGLDPAKIDKKNNTGSEAGDRWYEALRRACKLGIGVATQTQRQGFTNAKIHFLLDGLDLQSVATKTPTLGSDRRLRISITCSELRYTFRNWNCLNGKILFFVNGETVPAPWVCDFQVPDAFQKQLVSAKSWWDAYEAQRSLKHSGTLPKPMPGS